MKRNRKQKNKPVMQAGFFDHAATAISRFAGMPVTFFTALFIVLAWAISGPFFAYSETWQLVINTGTTIITFLLLFVVQSTQNRDTMALQLKLDSIIYVLTGCDNDLIKAEDMTLKELEAKVQEFKNMANKATPSVRSRRLRHITAPPKKPHKALP